MSRSYDYLHGFADSGSDYEGYTFGRKSGLCEVCERMTVLIRNYTQKSETTEENTPSDLIGRSILHECHIHCFFSNIRIGVFRIRTKPF